MKKFRSAFALILGVMMAAFSGPAYAAEVNAAEIIPTESVISDTQEDAVILTEIVEDVTFSSGRFSSDNTRGNGTKFSVADNINLYSTMDPPDNTSVVFQEDSTEYDMGSFYGIVAGYRHNTSPNYVYVMMNSNFEPYDFYEGLVGFKWEISNTLSSIVDILTWKPSGTVTVSSESKNVNVSFERYGVSVGTDFELFNRNTILSSGVTGGYRYETELTADTPVTGFQDLNAAILYNTDGADPTWSWEWTWTVRN